MKAKFVLTLTTILTCVFVWGCSELQNENDRDILTLPSSVSSILAGKSELDPRIRQYILPTRVIWTSSDGGASIERAEMLLEKRSSQITLDAVNPCVLKNSDNGTASILLDFGVEMQGGIEIMAWNTTDGKPVKVRVRFGESVSEAMSDNLYVSKNATNDHAIRDQFTMVPWLGTTEIGNTGFRFVRIDLLGKKTMLGLKSVKAIFSYRPIEYKGSFACNDQRLNQIWNVGAYTVHLNMQKYLWDGIKRDRLVWVGDMHPEAMTIQYVFGEQDIVPASLDLIRDETPIPKWMNGISSYSMWWLLIHHQNYLYTGNSLYLDEQREYIIGLINELVKYIDVDNKEVLPAGRFLDWPTQADPIAIHAGLQAMLILTLDAGADICGVFEDLEAKQKCLDAIEKLRKHIPDPNNSKQAAALMALAGLQDAKKLNQSVMAVDGAARMSTFYGYYVLQARAKAGDYQGCLDVIRDYWGGMLDMGATTFWEDFDIEWTENAARIDELVPDDKKDIHGDYGNYCYRGFRHSLCHGWASGPTAWLSEQVLGVVPIEPGCIKVKIRPHLGDLKWAEGTVPLPQGILKVRHERQPDGSIKSIIKAPAGVKVIK